jgi:hypothetical protein
MNQCVYIQGAKKNGKPGHQEKKNLTKNMFAPLLYKALFLSLGNKITTDQVYLLIVGFLTHLHNPSK